MVTEQEFTIQTLSTEVFGKSTIVEASDVPHDQSAQISAQVSIVNTMVQRTTSIIS